MRPLTKTNSIHSAPTTGIRIVVSLLVMAFLFVARTGKAQPITTTFEGLPVTSEGYYNGDTNADPSLRENYSIVGTAMNFGEIEYLQRWEIDDVRFNNNYTPAFASWTGWSWSRVADATTPGFANQYAAAPGGGADGMGGSRPGESYAVAYGISPRSAFINFPQGSTPETVELTNTTYAALAMRDGDLFSKKFGGPSGNDPDYFSVTLTGHEGIDATGNLLGSVTTFLADFRFENNSLDYILTDWLSVDLAPLGAARSIGLTFASSDVGPFGINTPTYLALDNLRFQLMTELIGDFNGDFALDCLDVDPLVAEIASGGSDLRFDLNGDETVDVLDLNLWLVEAGTHNVGGPYLGGDANLDGEVDLMDFETWNNHKFSSIAAWCNADFSADGFVDGSDMGIWNQNKFLSSKAFHLLPEPASWFILVILLGAVAPSVRAPAGSISGGRQNRI